MLTFQFLGEVVGPQGFHPGRFQLLHPHCLALQMRPMKGFLHFSPDFKKGAESGRQRGDDDPAGGFSTLGAHQIARAGVAAH